VKGRKRHVVVDTLGLLLSAVVHVANCQDRDGARPTLAQMKRKKALKKVKKIFADGAYSGEELADWAKAFGGWAIEIVKRTELHKFVVLPKRWIVERTFAWLGRCRRLSKDYEERTSSSVALLHLAMTHLMIRRLKPSC
jgi:putative transposase